MSVSTQSPDGVDDLGAEFENLSLGHDNGRAAGVGPNIKISFYDNYKKCPTNSFERPILYRTVHPGSNSLRARLYPPPALENLQRKDLKLHIINHSNCYSRQETPFISTTPDLMRALQLALCEFQYHEPEDVAIILICPWKLNPGSYMELNELCRQCGLQGEDKYKTETLIWGEIPERSILCRWTLSEIQTSGLFIVFPPLGTLDPKLKTRDVRNYLKEEDADDFISKFEAEQAAKALVKLGMNPAHFQIKQVFLFLLGQKLSYPVEKLMGDIEDKLKNDCPQLIEGFESAAYDLTVLAREGPTEQSGGVRIEGGLARVPSASTHIQAQEEQEATCSRLTPKSWWSQREECHRSAREKERMINADDYGLRKWAKECGLYESLPPSTSGNRRARIRTTL
ncbi:uncharacterized protein F4822DRAFT_350269 [Hypoxylon trugodes]|uniref:uncharacterized protein n=1 Tax=Hypoxylon trugodes TaxID=326681 RepID=UPI00219F92E1|nr:uncharacterized protein F4822DRAFT_350269 [Hypoxylon trugodes]KAI1385643.1 hypothetical protein F4822DRAFT_350269 [Hypoxylon trugodes]